MSYKFFELRLSEAKDLSVIFNNDAGNEIIMEMDHFARFMPVKANQPYIAPIEVSRAGGQIIVDGHDYKPRRMTYAESTPYA